jgi:hypothetical protein
MPDRTICTGCAAYALVSARKRKDAYKEEVFAALGNQCCRCGVGDMRVLTVDHVDGDGAAHRRMRGPSRDKPRAGAGITLWKLYREAVRIGHPRLQVLCFNCHALKDLHGVSDWTPRMASRSAVTIAAPCRWIGQKKSCLNSPLPADGLRMKPCMFAPTRQAKCGTTT